MGTYVVRDLDWVGQLIAKIEGASNGVLSAEIGGVPIVTTFGPEILQFFKTNQSLLLRIGQETFCNFLLLIHEKRDEQAFNLLLASMEADEIISRMNLNADVLHQYTTDKETFIANTKKWVISSLAPITIKVLLGLIMA